MTIWTIGHSAHSESAFIELAQAHGLRNIADVRRFPVSERHPHFRREELERWLLAAGFYYTWLGDSLGGLRGGSRGEGPWAGYRRHMKTADFEAGLERLVALAAMAPTALLCAEADFQHCHRQLIAEALAAAGHHVLHVLGLRETVPQQSSLFGAG